VRFILFSYYYPPDLSAGSFRAIALVNALSREITDLDSLHIITTHTNRYKDFRVKTEDFEKNKNVNIYRIKVPSSHGGIAFQAFSYLFYALKSSMICFQIKPDFIIGTSSRLMTGVLSAFQACIYRCKYYLDIRDIFSESFSDIYFKNSKVMRSIFKKFFLVIEKNILSRAAGVNVVAKSFCEYFTINGLNTDQWSTYSNGVDEDFFNISLAKKKPHSGKVTVLYAGNIGLAQGLASIIPEIAMRLKDNYRFQIIGDGSERFLLEENIKRYSLTNIDIIKPMPRKELIEYYKRTDVLFLHLSDVPAFKRVLPSKIFEYSVLGKPIIAGISGYSRIFLEKNVPHSLVFKPGDLEECLNSFAQLKSISIDIDYINQLKIKYARKNIMINLATKINNFAQDL
jgi:hypothetical protein